MLLVLAQPKILLTALLILFFVRQMACHRRRHPWAPAVAAITAVLALCTWPVSEAVCPGREYLLLGANATGSLASPGDLYPENTSCEWLLQAPAGTAITVTWQTSASECNFDFLSVCCVVTFPRHFC